MSEQQTDRHNNFLPWFSSDKTTMEVLQKVFMDNRWLESLKYYVHFRLINTWVVPMMIGILLMSISLRHTVILDSFHNLVVMCNPKRMRCELD